MFLTLKSKGGFHIKKPKFWSLPAKHLGSHYSP